MSSLWESIARPGAHVKAAFHGPTRSVALAPLATASFLDGHLEALRGREILLWTQDQLDTALALVELDGAARRIVLATPDLQPPQLSAVAAMAEVDAVVLAPGMIPPAGLDAVRLTAAPVELGAARRAGETTEWILLTSGTTGQPKLVVHSFESLAGGLPPAAPSGVPTVWGTFYDIRRYGGLQIFLRAARSGADLVLSSADEPVVRYLERAAAAGVTHLSGTPSHWRRMLMSGGAGLLNPRYVRLSGEIADQAVLDQLRAAYPQAVIAHAFASTEAGVAFDVDDGLAGFPAEYLSGARRGVDMKVEDGTLRIRSSRNAARYLGDGASALLDRDRYVDTGDLVELVGGRYHFRGRRGGVINVGGMKVHPEEVESVLNADQRVRMSLVRARRNPITGAIVVADVVLADAWASDPQPELVERIKQDLLDACRRCLPAHKVPTQLRIVPSLPLTAAGKLVRPGA